MSALASQQSILVAPRWLSELEATREISRTVSSARDRGEILETLRALALKVKGVVGVQVRLAAEHLMLKDMVNWKASAGSATPGSAIAPISSGGIRWGELRLHFDLRDSGLESPLQFARFLAQQIAAVLSRTSLEDQGERLREQIERLRRIVTRRKLIHRAKALIANRRNISDGEALAMMCRWSRESGQTLHQVAEAFILSEETTWHAKPRYRPRQVRRTIRFPVGSASRSHH